MKFEDDNITSLLQQNY